LASALMLLDIGEDGVGFWDFFWGAPGDRQGVMGESPRR
jgi:hypothetical protein